MMINLNSFQIVLDMIVGQQVSSDLLSVASGTFYALICAYQVHFPIVTYAIIQMESIYKTCVHLLFLGQYFVKTSQNFGFLTSKLVKNYQNVKILVFKSQNLSKIIIMP